MAKAAAPRQTANTRNPAREFLETFLAGGPIIRRNVYREADNQNLEWEDVKYAFFNLLNGREYQQKGEYFWRIFY